MGFNSKQKTLIMVLGLIIGAMLLETVAYTQGFGGGRFRGFGGGRRGGFGSRYGRVNMDGRNRIQDVSTDLEELIDPDSTLKPYATVRGVVYGKDGKTPAEGITITIERQDATGKYQVKSKADGKYLYDGLPGGEYVLAVIWKGDIGLPRPATLRNGRTVVSDFDLKEFQSIGKANSLDDLRKGWDAEKDPEEDTQKMDRETRDLYDKAKEAQVKGDYATAISILKELVSKEPGSKVPAFWNRLGENYLMTQKYDDAVAAYRVAIELRPDSGDYMGNFAMALLLADKIDEGTVATEKTAALSKERGAQAYYNLGLALTDKSEAKKAESAFETAIKLDAGYAEAHYQLGLTYLSTRASSNPATPNVDAVVPLKVFIGKAQGDPALAETVGIAKLLIAEVCKPAPAAKLENCKK